MLGLPNRIILTIAAAATLAGCEAVRDVEEEAADERLDAIPLSQNLVEEDCRALPNFAATQASSNLLRAYDIYCGRWEEPSGRVFEVSAIGGGPTLLRQYTEQSWWRADLNNTMDCEPAQPTRILEATDALVLDCNLRAGGWPYTALATDIDGGLYLGDGIPAVLPALENMMAVLSGRVAPGETIAGRKSEEVQRLETLLAGRLFGTGDLQDYRRLLQVAQYYNGIKNFSEAEKRYRDALEIHRRVLADDSPGRGDALMHLALELSNQERFSEAGALFERAEELLLTATDPTDGPRLVSYRALHAANQQNFADGLALAQQATVERQSLAKDIAPSQSGLGRSDSGLVQIGLADVATGDTRTTRGLRTILEIDSAQSLYIEAAMALRLDQLDEADAAVDEALSIIEGSPSAPEWWHPQINFLKAQIASARDDHAAAAQLLERTVEEQRELFTNSRTEGLALLALGDARVRLGQNEEAFAAFRDAYPIIEAQGGGLRFDEVRPFFESATEEAAADPGRADALRAEMFEAGQLVRGTVTSQTIAVAAARLSASDQEVGSLIRELQDAQIERDQLNEDFNRAQASEEATEAQLGALEAALADVGQRIRELEQQVQAASPGYNQLIDAPTRTEDLIALLRPDEAVVQILLGEPTSQVFFVTRDGVQTYPIDLGRAEAAALVEHLRVPFDAVATLPNFDVVASYELFRTLFGPVAGELASYEHLIVVPTGPLLSLPMQVLVTRQPTAVTNYDYTNIRWLGEQHALTLATSVRALVDLRGTRPSVAAKTLIGFGDFVPLDDPSVLLEARELPETCRSDIEKLKLLGRLPETASELRTVAQALGAPSDNLVLGSAFSEEKLRTAGLSDFRIVYFAAHGLLPGQLDCWSEPSLLTSRPLGASAEDDGLLEASEILDLDLDAELVVLSACNTGGEGEGGGESLTGLARAFFYAGARSLLVSHWEVPSRETVSLMTGTFTSMAEEDRPSTAEALRRSQLAMMRDRDLSHPYYWAAFTVVGDGGRQISL